MQIALKGRQVPYGGPEKSCRRSHDTSFAVKRVSELWPMLSALCECLRTSAELCLRIPHWTTDHYLL